MTPKEFLARPRMQDLTALHMINRLADEHQPEEIALIWFTGEASPEPGQSDVNGVTASEYKQRFLKHYLAYGN